MKTVVRFAVDRGFESYSLRQRVLNKIEKIKKSCKSSESRLKKIDPGEMAELAEGARLLSECRVISSTEGSNPSLSAI